MQIQNWSKGVAVLLGLAVVLSACTTLDPYTREEQAARAQRQAVIGAGVGAAVGLITGDSSMERKKRALVGAGLGALAGAGVGTYMDRQEAKLRAELERTGVSVTRDRRQHYAKYARKHHICDEQRRSERELLRCVEFREHGAGRVRPDGCRGRGPYRQHRGGQLQPAALASAVPRPWWRTLARAACCPPA